VTALLDPNVLIALVVAEHVHHDYAAEWLAAATLDSGLAHLHSDVGVLIPTTV
jgi:uncharacterized protein